MLIRGTPFHLLLISLKIYRFLKNFVEESVLYSFSNFEVCGRCLEEDEMDSSGKPARRGLINYSIHDQRFLRRT